MKLKIKTDGSPIGTQVESEGIDELKGATLAHVSFGVNVDDEVPEFCIRGYLNSGVEFEFDFESLLSCVDRSSEEPDEDAAA